MSSDICMEPSQINLQFNDSFRSCRICLLEARQHQEEQEIDFIAPCKCCGSLQFVHRRCLLKWMNTIVLRNLKEGRNTPFVKCEVCMQEYRAKSQVVWQISTCAKMKAIYKETFVNKLLLIASILLILVCLGALGLFIYLLKVEGIQAESKDEQLAGYIIAFFFVAIALIVWIIILLKTYILKRIGYFTQVYDKSQGLEKEEQKSPKQKSPRQKSPRQKNPKLQSPKQKYKDKKANKSRRLGSGLQINLN